MSLYTDVLILTSVSFLGLLPLIDFFSLLWVTFSWLFACLVFWTEWQTLWILFCQVLGIFVFLCSGTHLSFLETVWSFWGLLLVLISWDQNIHELILPHYWENPLLRTLSDALWYMRLALLTSGNINYSLPCVSSRDCFSVPLCGCFPRLR